METPRAALPPRPLTGPLVLGSGSPRRRELLARAGVAFEVQPADIDERARPGEVPRALAERLAREKALAVARRVGPAPARLVLGADTIVVLDGDVLGKPEGPEDAVHLLGRLVGRAHRVLTAIALVESEALGDWSAVVESRVWMRPADAGEIRRYVATGEPLDKAGAYAAQGEGRRFIERIEGSETNVIGLPLEETLALLREAGLDGVA
jgi:septum formation protein